MQELPRQQSAEFRLKPTNCYLRKAFIHRTGTRILKSERVGPQKFSALISALGRVVASRASVISTSQFGVHFYAASPFCAEPHAKARSFLSEDP